MSPLVGATGGEESREGVPAWFAAAGWADFDGDVSGTVARPPSSGACRVPGWLTGVA